MRLSYSNCVAARVVAWTGTCVNGVNLEL
jgi:hypothetical protein